MLCDGTSSMRVWRVHVEVAEELDKEDTGVGCALPHVRHNVDNVQVRILHVPSVMSLPCLLLRSATNPDLHWLSRMEGRRGL